MLRRLSVAVLVLALASPLPVPAQQRPVAPRLVLALAVDQLRPDYLERWRGEFTGGFARLLREGVFYPNGLQDHAVTETAPGHSTMMTGRNPRNTGIVSNDLGVPDPAYPLLGSTATGASPRRFTGTTLFDWMLGRDSAVLALSVSRKDRSAILPMGRAKVPVFWYSAGNFTTSKWYADSLPPWVKGWNAKDPIAKLAGYTWNPLRDPATYPERDDRPFEVGGRGNAFPHVLPEDWTMAASGLADFPVMDSLLLDFAWTGIRTLGIGRRERPDFVSLSLSTTDAIGHKYGAGSREMHDHLLRLDRWLGVFLDSLDAVTGREGWVASLTADHGSQDYPEATPGLGRGSMSAMTRSLGNWIKARWRFDAAIADDSGLLFGDVPALAARGVNVDSLSEALAADARKLPGVRAVYTPRSLAAAKATDAEAAKWKRQIAPDFPWFVAVALRDGWVWGSSKTSTGHGTTNRLDMAVPILFRVPGVAGRTVTRTARTIDIAPTLAVLLGIRPTERVDGVALTEVIGRTGAAR